MEQEKLTKAVVVGVSLKRDEDIECERSLDELCRLVDTAGGEVIARVVQNKETPDVRTCIGSGKLAELKNLCNDNAIELVVFDTDLSPSQIRNIEDELDSADVIDRSMLILDIFALHAVSAEGKLQVELAQLKYTAPRLIGKGKQLSRQEGRIGTRGPGESKLESDRRHLARRVTALEENLRELEKNRATMRAARGRSGIVKAAIVGYTNAGKSTLLNRLTDAGILAEDKLFATLDPTTRKMTLPGGTELLLTDTVGFIRKLPHHLIKAFKSTLDELVFADILIVTADASDDECEDELKVTRNLIDELGASDKPILYVFNKIDIASDDFMTLSSRNDNVALISAKTGAGMETFLSKLETLARAGKIECFLKIPLDEQSVLSQIYKFGTVLSSEYSDDCVEVRAVLDLRGRGMFEKYIVNGSDNG